MTGKINNKSSGYDTSYRPIKINNPEKTIDIVPQNIALGINHETAKDIEQYEGISKFKTSLFDPNRSFNLNDKKTVKSLCDFISSNNNSSLVDKNDYIKSILSTRSGENLLENKDKIDTYLKKNWE